MMEGDSKLEKWLDGIYLAGKEESRIEARAESLEALRYAIAKSLKARFPCFVGEAWNATDEIDSIETLVQLIAEFAIAPDEDAAQRVLEAHTQQQ